MAEGRTVADSLVTEFATYSDFLDSQITPRDLYYLEVYGCGEVKGRKVATIQQGMSVVIPRTLT